MPKSRKLDHFKMKSSRAILNDTSDNSIITGPLTLNQAVKTIRQSGLFDEDFYVQSYGLLDPIIRFVDPISHYLVHGHSKGYKPSEFYNVKEEPSNDTRFQSKGVNPLLRLALKQPGRVTSHERQISAELHKRPATWIPYRLASDTLRLPPRRRKREPPVLDVIIPVYAGYDETIHTIYSVLKSKNTTSYELLVVDDNSPEQRLSETLEKIASGGHITYLKNPSNFGFVRTVNRALKIHPDRDAILLNSDTLVFRNWIDRLKFHVTDEVATVTPFSNNASLCSYPRIYEDNVPTTNPEILDRRFSNVNQGMASCIPTGVGFCMYVSRKALNMLGNFDVRHFGKGYGEETDFCLRALAGGLRNLHAHDVYVYHKGGVSFGQRAETLQKRHLQRIHRRHPTFKVLLREFASADQALWARQRIDLASALAGSEAKRTLCVFNDPQSCENRITKRYSERAKKEGLMGALPESGERTLQLRPASRLLEAPNLRNIEFVGPDSKFEKILIEGKFTHVEIHSMCGDQLGFSSAIKRHCRALGIDVTTMT